jgi:hypothetical protein
MMQSRLHIISFDIPYPANYGGVIDVFHKVRCLNQIGVKVILHCFEYGGKKGSAELESMCEKVYYYKRNTSLINHLSYLPYNIKSRIDLALKQNLLKDNYPILFEVLHTCYLLNDPDFVNRKKLFRHSNIEHDYFLELAKGEKSFLKKIYLRLEAFKLKYFEKKIKSTDCILAVSETDLLYFKKKYPNTQSIYLPSFHQFDYLQCKSGKGNYILYHGNLSISENYNAALWLIKNVFSKLNYPIIIAGLNPPQHLVDAINAYPQISLQQNCSELQMQMLIEDAQIHCLYTEQATGLKLKLLNVLYSGRFVIANNEMLTGTQLNAACSLANSPHEYLQQINVLFQKDFTLEEILLRKNLVATMNNSEKVNTLLSVM